jgi:hypothetical protein
MSLNRIKAVLALAIGLTGYSTATSVAATAAPEWHCKMGSGYCCDCVWADTYRQCNALSEPGNYYEKCGVADDTPCTGDCMIVS